MRYIYYILFVLICSSNFTFSQQISVDDSVALEPLIQNNLVDGCVDISNISSTVNGNSNGFPSYAYFERGSSNFPFQNGIMLSTGSAASGGNAVRTPTLSEGSTAWGTDPDLEAALGITNTVNATSIEFDFISISNQFQFNYLLASEEYFGINPCQFSDGFVFLIREAGTSDPYQNIALVPGTSTPVNTNTIHDEIFGVCAAQNDQYFEGYNLGDTNYNGRTTVLTASGSIEPNVTYHIKLIIADQTDGTFDSAVFIEGDSFRILDLGEDIATCAAFATLNANIENPLASYSWYLDGSLITGAVTPSINAILSGTYRVEVSVPVSGTNCIEEDEIVVILNTEEPINPISDYELCDDASGDEIEIFDLSTKDSELINNIPFTNYVFSYHLSDADARNNLDAITVPIPNTSNPQTIYVRIDDADSDCFSYTTFDLIVNPVPNITTPTDLDICDSDDNPDGFAIIDLTQKNDEITTGNGNLLVSYHYNPLDASTGDNPIPTPYINSNTPTDLIYVRIVDTTTGCINTNTFNVNVQISPIVNRDTQYIDACDSDLDGNANFDLTEVIDEILAGLTGVSTTFHISTADAQTGENPIADETNYQYTNAVIEPGSATLYLRIVDDTTGCFSIVPFEIHTNLLLTGTDTGDFALCDDNEDSTDTLEFNLITVESFIANDLPNPITVTFYETEEDRNNNDNPLDKSQLYEAVSPQVLFIRIEDGECVENTEITLLVNPILLFEPVEPIPYCDTDDDGITSIDLASLDDIITGGNTNFTVTYFLDETDAENNNTANQLPPFYTNTNSIETLYARIESINSGCSSVNPFQIEIYVAPATTKPSDIVVCDNDQDGFSVVNLNDKISEIVPSTTGLDIDFFTSFEDADNDTNFIPVNERDAYNTDTQTIYVRVEDNVSDTNCYAIVFFEAIINTLPVIANDIRFQVCEPNGNSTADFILPEIDPVILDGQTGKDVYYFENEVDAINGNLTNAIPKDRPYNSGTRTIYIRVENITDSTCLSTGSIIIEVAPEPIYDPIIDYLVCDDDSNDGVNIFDLEDKANEIKATSPDVLNISFHLNPTNANNNLDPLPLSYTNVTNPQSIYVRIESEDSLCYVVEELGINIIAAPDVTQVTSPLINCDTGYDGITDFDLTTANFQILDRVQSNLIINYFENLTDINSNDGLDNTNEIDDPSNFNSNSQTVYIKVANTLTGCYTVIDLELIVNSPPPINTIGTIPICDNDTDTYNLSLINSMIVDDTSVVDISYHDSLVDSESDTDPLNTNFNYTSNNHTIFIRVSDVSTGCHISSSFNLQINENPTPMTPPNLVDCDDDFDGLLEFNLSEQDSDILGTLNPSDYRVRYYNNINDAETGENALPNFYPTINEEIIYARLENNDTGCYGTTQFTTYVNPLPVIPIDDVVPMCINRLPLIINAYTGNPNDTYLWSTGETTSQIQLNNPSQIGDYWVTATTPNVGANDCPFTKEFSVVESEDANINFTTTVDFADPNSITVDVRGIGDYVYILDDGEPQTSNVFENVTFGIHLVTIRDLNGCNDVTTEVVVIDIPKFFTPNNDSVFDTWHIVGITEIPGTVVYIYNRYGKLLKTLPHTALGWDGTFNGQNMPADDYWFVASVLQNGENFEVKGHFALKR